jgi:hypothetical protein
VADRIKRKLIVTLRNYDRYRTHKCECNDKFKNAKSTRWRKFYGLHYVLTYIGGYSVVETIVPNCACFLEQALKGCANYGLRSMHGEQLSCGWEGHATHYLRTLPWRLKGPRDYKSMALQIIKIVRCGAFVAIGMAAYAIYWREFVDY